MNKRLTIELGSDLDYEEMAVYLSWDNEHFATLNCERGLDNIEIELFSLNENHEIFMPLEDYLKGLEFAKSVLLRAVK